jgi:hypothetical protein
VLEPMPSEDVPAHLKEIARLRKVNIDAGKLITRLRIRNDAHEMGWDELGSRIRREAKWAREQEAATSDFDVPDGGPEAIAYSVFAAFCEAIIADLLTKPEGDRR